MYYNQPETNKELSDDSSSGPCQIQSIPEEILLKIFSYLSICDLLQCSRVSDKWDRITSDINLWNEKINSETTKWVGLFSKKSQPLLKSDDNIKLKYQAVNSIENIETFEFKTGFIANFKWIISHLFTGNYLNILVVGSGLDNHKTRKFFNRIFSNNCSNIELIGQFNASIGSGITMKISSQSVVAHKFNLHLLPSNKPTSSSYDHQNQDKRLRESCLFNDVTDADITELKVSENALNILQTTGGFVYSIENYDKKENHDLLFIEFQTLVKSLPAKSPVVIIVINTDGMINNVSTFEVAQTFNLFDLDRQWCVLKTDDRNTQMMTFFVLWLIQNNS